MGTLSAERIKMLFGIDWDKACAAEKIGWGINV